jgi:hypothetical protein
VVSYRKCFIVYSGVLHDYIRVTRWCLIGSVLLCIVVSYTTIYE